ncbi:hypothetical protein AeNC1_004094 [Aphanomyces euteiches]|nr:hypothetical protein AeNC1_004094 [Aphanomyces euteiches]
MEERSGRRRATQVLAFACIYLTSCDLVHAQPAAYPEFPYCSKHVEQNVIERLQSPDQYKLQQVQIVMRHGARVLASHSFCWAGYNVTWTCNARMHVSPSLEVGGALSSHHVYDNKYLDGETVLKGNCHIGQLLDEGYNQEVENGRIFRKAYVETNQLFRSDEQIDLSNSNDFYLSSTDMQRTVMSGQLVIDAMFPPAVTSDAVVPWHIGDIAQSSYVPNPSSCPKLADIKAQYESSAGYIQWHDAHAPVVNLTKTIFDTYDERILFDCLLTSRCSMPSSLPPTLSVAQYDSIVNYERDKRMKIYTEDPLYSKVSMAKVLLSIRNRILARIHGDGPRFALYSGHDDTVMPILAALGGSAWLLDWPPYAAFLAMELYADANNATAHFVRFIYQGKPLTLPGCRSDKLCPLELLLAATDYATDPNVCKASFKGPTTAMPIPVAASSDGETHVSFKALVLFVFVGLLLGVVFGLIIARTFAKNNQASSLSATDARSDSDSKALTIQTDYDDLNKGDVDERDELLSSQSPKHE